MSRARKCFGASGLSLLLRRWAEELKMLALFIWGKQGMRGGGVMGLIFSYRAKNKNAEHNDGTIEAIDENDALKKLEEQGLIVISIRQGTAETKSETKLLPKDFLHPGEEVILEIRPIRGEYCIMTILLIICSLIWKWWRWIPFFPIIVIVFLAELAQIAKWKNTFYALTNKRVITAGGLTVKEFKECSLDKIQNIELKFTHNSGSIAFDTAGTPLKELMWKNIRNPKEVYQKVSAVLHK